MSDNQHNPNDAWEIEEAAREFRKLNPLQEGLLEQQGHPDEEVDVLAPVDREQGYMAVQPLHYFGPFSEWYNVYLNQNAAQPPPPQANLRTLPRPPPPSTKMVESTPYTTRVAAGKNDYGSQLQDKPAVNARPPANIDIGMLEICTFFPSWLQIPAVSMRAVRNGWTRKDISLAQLHASDKLTKDELKKAEGRVQKQYSVNGLLYNHSKGWTETEWSGATARTRFGQDNDLTSASWLLRYFYGEKGAAETEFRDVKLTDVTKSVTNWPTGADRLILTQCLELAHQHPQLDLDTSHFPWIMQQLGLAAVAVLDNSHDDEAVRRLRDAVPKP